MDASQSPRFFCVPCEASTSGIIPQGMLPNRRWCLCGVPLLRCPHCFAFVSATERERVKCCDKCKKPLKDADFILTDDDPNLLAFQTLFKFDRKKAGCVGVERECFLVDDRTGMIAPLAPQVVAHLGDVPRFGYELSACQLEERIGPCSVRDVTRLLEENDRLLKRAERELEFTRSHAEVGPEDICLDVYPDPSGRYQIITKTMPREVLLAACRVIGTHVHVGMPDLRTALRVYNRVIESCQELCEKGDGSNGQRLKIYQTVAPKCTPPRYESWEAFHRVAIADGFDRDPRKCWTLIRISAHGTIEFRMFGATPSFERIQHWAELCRNLCMEEGEV